jgi:hypothetical protein
MFVAVAVPACDGLKSRMEDEPMADGSDKDVKVVSTVTAQQLAALGDILDALAGTPLERTGDISIEVDDTRYVISQQTGGYSAAAVDRSRGQEVVGEPTPYRRELVAHTAQRGLALAHDEALGVMFTLSSLIGDDWEALSPVEQRNAGKRFRRLLVPRPLGEVEEWTETDNEWRYRKTG